MALITASINGWMKRMEVSDYILADGYFFVTICPPMEFAIKKSDIVINDNIKKVKLVRTGDYLFEYL